MFDAVNVATVGGLLGQDEDEEQGTLTFGKRKEQASYGGMDEEEKAIWKARFLRIGVRARVWLRESKYCILCGGSRQIRSTQTLFRTLVFFLLAIDQEHFRTSSFVLPVKYAFYVACHNQLK